MSIRSRDYVGPNAIMYRAVAYDASEHEVRATGPYATRRAAMASRHWCKTRDSVLVRVEACSPQWQPIPGTELEP